MLERRGRGGGGGTLCIAVGSMLQGISQELRGLQELSRESVLGMDEDCGSEAELEVSLTLRPSVQARTSRPGAEPHARCTHLCGEDDAGDDGQIALGSLGWSPPPQSLVPISGLAGHRRDQDRALDVRRVLHAGGGRRHRGRGGEGRRRREPHLEHREPHRVL
jgi:hypothetical protein